MSSIITDKNGDNSPNHTTTANGYTHQRLYYLHDLEDYKVHHDDTDVRGWKVKLGTGEVVGTVENLVVDKAAQKVRYLEVTGDRGFFSSYQNDGYYLDKDSGRVYDADTDSHFLVPIAMASLDHSDHEVYLEGVQTGVVGGVPRYRRGSSLLPNYEVATLDYYTDNDSVYASNYDRTRYRDLDRSFRSLDDQFYTSGYFNDERYYDRHREAITSKGL